LTGKNNKKPKLLVILGPTASGKSDLAVRLAKKFNGEIVSADSRQVYKGLNIGAGKVPRDKIKTSDVQKLKNWGLILGHRMSKNYFYKSVPHHLLDVASPKKTFTVSQYQKLGEKAVKDILKRGKLPIICGGTGFYIDALVSGLKLPEVPPQKELRKKLEKESTEFLFNKLKKLDLRRAKTIDRFNKRRLIRALEIVLTTKKPVPSGVMIYHNAQPNYDVLKIGIKKEPEELKKLIHKRLVKRLKQGIIKEVENLHNPPAGGGLSWKRLDDFGLEYRYVSRYLRGLISKTEMSDLIEKESWRYAKRQMTWFKRDKNIIWTNTPQKAFSACRDWLGL
jgi:tRNA dimethylallyltransferase